MSTQILLLSLLLLFLILLSAFFSASEISMMSLNRYRLRHLVRKQHKQATRVNQLLARPDYLLSAILIGNTTATIIASMLSSLIGQSLYGEWGIVIATILLTVAILVIAEIAPKTLGALYAQQIAFRVSWLLLFFQRLFSPLIWLSTQCSKRLLALFGIVTDAVPKETLSGEELRTVVLEAGGLLHVEHKSMLLGLLDLETATIEDIMIPKSKLIGLDINAPWHQVLSQLKTAQHTRLPIYRDSIENIVGLAHVKHILHLAVENTLTLPELLAVTDAPYYIPENTKLTEQIGHFRHSKKRSAFVVDEYGNIQGLVTLEDILEEIIGEFTTDVAALSRELVPQADGAYLIDGSVTLREINRSLGWQLPMIGPKTLSGLIIEMLSAIPPADCCVKINEYEIEILKVQDNLIRTVKMWRRSPS